MTKEEVLDAYSVVSLYWKDRLLEAYPQYLKENFFEDGKIYTYENTIFQYYPINISAYTKDFSEKLESQSFSNYIKNKAKYCFRVLDRETITKFLREEASRRGYKIGTKYLYMGNLNLIGGDVFIYYSNGDHLTDGYGGAVYDKGVWSQIIT